MIFDRMRSALGLKPILSSEKGGEDLMMEAIGAAKSKDDVSGQALVRETFVAQLGGLGFAFSVGNEAAAQGFKTKKGRGVGDVLDAFARGVSNAISTADQHGLGEKVPQDVRDIVQSLNNRGTMSADEWKNAMARINAFVDSVDPSQHTKH
jgi:hypothetical protein